jgi:hypothetical protein
MHQTTVRFGPDLWEALEVECGRLGVSAAQFLREAAVARLSYTAGRRGEPEYELALVEAGAAPTAVGSSARATRERVTLEEVREASSEQMLAAKAVSAQSSMVWRRAAEVRARAAELRRMRREMGT